MNIQSIAGYYGKIPMRGDFVQRNLPAEFIQCWDQWLQSVINSSQSNLNEQWLNCYLVSPVWCYFLTLEDGISYAGAMLPSVDKVGRYFPFTIALPLNSIPAKEFISQNERWYSGVSQLAMMALDENIPFEQLNQKVDDIHNHIVFTAPPSYAASNSYYVDLNNQMTLTQGINQITNELPASSNNHFSYWWTPASNTHEGKLLCCDGFPDDNIYTAMLDGQWQLCYAKNLGVDNNLNSINNLF